MSGINLVHAFTLYFLKIYFKIIHVLMKHSSLNYHQTQFLDIFCLTYIRFVIYIQSCNRKPDLLESWKDKELIQGSICPILSYYFRNLNMILIAYSVTTEEQQKGLFRISFSYWELHILHRKLPLDEICSWERHPNLKALTHQTEG